MVQLLGSTIPGFGLLASIPGGTVWGTAVSRDDWLELWFNQMKASGPAGTMLAGAFELSIQDSGIILLDDDLEDDWPTYIHLKAATVHLSSGDMGPMLFRMKLSEVSGWSMGVSRPDEAGPVN
jgi:hypothetical protein